SAPRRYRFAGALQGAAGGPLHRRARRLERQGLRLQHPEALLLRQEGPERRDARAPGGRAPPETGADRRLQIVPSAVLLRPGQKARFTVRGIDANGFVTETFDAARAKWAHYIPPTARVRSEMNAEFNAQGELVAANATEPSAGAFQATIGD